MLDIGETKEYLFGILESIFNFDKDSFPDLSWKDGSPVKTTDPLKFVLINYKKNEIILKELDHTNREWVIHYLRGIIHCLFHDDMVDSYAAWNLSTLFALLLLPTSYLNKAIQTKFLKAWKKSNSTLQIQDKKYVFPRYYYQLDTNPFSVNKELILNFGKHIELNTEEQLMDAFNRFLFIYIPTIKNKNDLDILSKALKYQTLDNKRMNELFDLSDSKIYRSKSNLGYALGQYLGANRLILGLTSSYILNCTDKIHDQLKFSKYYENFESYNHTQNLFVKMQIPIIAIPKIMKDYYPSNNSIYFYLNIPDQWELRYAPEMYDLETTSWKSVTTINHEIISIKEERNIYINDSNINEYELNIDEIKLLKEIILSKTDNLSSLKYDTSKLEARRMISRFKEIELYKERVLWRIPRQLLSATLTIQISESVEIRDIPNQLFTQENTFSLLNYLDSVLKDHPTGMEFFTDIREYSWPSLSIEYAFEFRKNKTISVSKVVILRIHGIIQDLLNISGYNEYSKFLGVMKISPGSVVTIPESEYIDNQWLFDVKGFLRILSTD
ncbi:MAG: hypothetical protein OEZ01_10025 [Candidatus Heimdallarchaeota archaeon]|nr:hypothetical protein [Candidatus Heimdallarchaeota archaeon]